MVENRKWKKSCAKYHLQTEGIINRNFVADCINFASNASNLYHMVDTHKDYDELFELYKDEPKQFQFPRLPPMWLLLDTMDGQFFIDAYMYLLFLVE